jgi:hypothetical protein
MNANRALGLVAAILVTAGQALLFAVDTSASAPSSAKPVRYDTALGARNSAEAQRRDGQSLGLSARRS